MYIKQIIIQGFKSYKDQIVVEPFSPGTNVVVGRNGSGKSNFFAAVLFVMSDTYNNLGREERAALLHEGAGSAVNTAYVEIIFDNSDKRFLSDSNEFAIRRTIGHKKDEYSVDKKVLPKKEVLQLLDTAGFSRSNPFYIVPQGRVTALTNMRERDRLNLLKEIAGTHVYETRRAESLKIMTETRNKREKIDESLGDVTERLKELEEEREELKAFQTSDRERRCLEYAFYHQEQQITEQALAELEDARRGGGGSNSEHQQEFLDGEKAIAQMDAQLSTLQQQLNLLRIDRKQLEEDRRDAAKSRAKIELQVRNSSENHKAREQAKTQSDADLAAVKKEIKTKEADLKKLLPEYQKRRTQEEQVKQTLDTTEASRSRLFTKQTRSSQFKNRADRDAYLKKEIADLNDNMSKQRANVMDAEEEVKRVAGSIKRLEADIEGLREQREGYGSGRQGLADKVASVREEYDSLSEERKRLRREEDKLDSVLSKAQDEQARAERELSHAMDHPTARGLATIRQILRERDIPGAYGTLAELMTVSEPYRIAAEQTAGTSLFHYIVDNEETGTLLLNELQRRQGGRITVVPLSRVKPRRVNMPKANDIVPLINKIKYDAEYENAFQQVFGRTVVTSSAQAGGQYSRSHGVDAITSDGVIINKKGVIQGGYVDTRKSRLLAVQTVSRSRDECEKVQDEMDDARKQIERKDQEITHAFGQLQKAEQELRRAEGGLEPLQAELRNKSAQLERERDHVEAAGKRRDGAGQNMKDFGLLLESLEVEMASEFKKALSNQEEQQLEDLGNKVQELQKQWNVASKARRGIETQKQILELDLRQRLRPKEDQLNNMALDSSTSAEDGSNLADAQKELKKIQKTTAMLDGRFKEVMTQFGNAEQEISAIEAARTAKEQAQQDLAMDIERQQKRLEKSMQRKTLLSTQLDECSKNIRDLGVLPDEAFTKYIKTKPKDITTKLKKVNDTLKKYKHVNKKAFEQHNSFTTQQKQLLKRCQDLDESQASIEELIAHLDERKDEAIERTFRQVSKEFSEIFQRLVPAGHGRLVIARKVDARQADGDDSDEEQQRNSVENYTGVGINVSFNSKEMDEQQKVQQLSGGQKSLCALCLIFALQRTEVSPFVIFDEVDANLDAQYRTAVAGLLQSLSKEAHTQFICTTFRPEIVHVADKCYGVTFRNKSSRIGCYDREEALEFVEGQAPR